MHTSLVMVTSLSPSASNHNAASCLHWLHHKPRGMAARSAPGGVDCNQPALGYMFQVVQDVRDCQRGVLSQAVGSTEIDKSQLRCI